FSFSLHLSSHPHIYSLSLHDALPISLGCLAHLQAPLEVVDFFTEPQGGLSMAPNSIIGAPPLGLNSLVGAGTRFPSNVACLLIRSEEHTSELQSRVDLVCRLLLEKQK